MHSYELPLAVEDFEHRTTKLRSPRTNGFVERMNRTLLDKRFCVADSVISWLKLWNCCFALR